MSSTITLQSVVDFNRARTRMVQLVNVGGIPNQPALDICNDVLQTLLSAPNNWKFNKAAIPSFTTIPYQQDYLVSGCQMKITTAGGGPRANVFLNSVFSSTAGLTEASTTVTATFSDFAPNGVNGIGGTNPIVVGDLVTIINASQSAYNVTNAAVTAVPNSTSLQFVIGTSGLAADGGQGINDLSWVEHCTLQDYMSGATVKPVHDIEVVSALFIESIIQPPFKACMLADTVTTQSNQSVSVLTMRFWPVPSSQIWNSFFFYQQKAPLKTQLLQTWTPWPDDLGYVLRSGVYAKALDHAEDPRAGMADAKWQQDILKALDIRQQEQRSEGYFPDLPILRGG